MVRTLQSHGASRSKWKLDPLDGQMGKKFHVHVVDSERHEILHSVSQKASSPLPNSKVSGSPTLSPTTVRDVPV